jgi:hypothetical protein
MASAGETAPPSATAHLECPEVADHLIQYSEYPHPEYRSGNEMFNGRFPSQKNCRRCLKVTWHAEYQPSGFPKGKYSDLTDSSALG